MKKLTFFFDAFFSILVISLPFSKALPNLLLPLLIVLFIIKEKKIKNKLILFSSTFLFSFFFLLSSLINNSFFEDQSILKKILLLPLLMLLTLGIKNVNMIKISFVTGVVTTNIIIIFKIVFQYYQQGFISFGNNETVNQILLIDRPYLGFANVIAFILVFELIKIVKKKWILMLIMAFIFLFLILIVARLSILTIVILSFLILLFKNKKANSKKWTFFIILIISCFIVLTKSNNSFSERFYIKSSLRDSYNHFLFQEPRVVIWSCVFKIIKNENFNLFIGSGGFKQNQVNLTNCYNNKILNASKKDYYISEQFNTHNQFLDFLLSGGVIGMILFIFIIINSYYNSYKNLTSFAIFFSFILFFLVENVIWRQWGVYFLGILLTLFLNKKKLLNE